MHIEVTYKRLSKNQYEISVGHESLVTQSRGEFLDHLEKIAAVCSYSYTENNKLIKEAMSLTRENWV